MALSIKSKTAIHKTVAGVVLLVIVSITGLLLSTPIPVVYKLGFILLPGILLFSSLNPFGTISLFFLFRPELQLFSEAGLLKIFSVLVIIFAFFVFTTSKGRFNFCWDKLKYLYLFLLVAIVSMLYSIQLQGSLISILKILSFISTYLLTFNLVKSREDGIKLLSCFPLAAILPLIYGFYQLLSGQVYVVPGVGLARFSSFFYIANNFGRFLLVISVASIPLFLYIDRRKRRLLALLLIAGIGTIGLIGVRSVWILTAISLLLIIYFLPETRKYLLTASPLLILLLLGILIKGFESVINPDVHKIYGDSLYMRFALWDQLFTKVVVKKAVLGFGVGTSAKAAQTYTTFGNVPHNDYLQVLVETGILGFIPYLLFLISNLVSAYKDTKIYKENRYFNVCALALFVSFMVSMMASNTFYEISFMWYFFGYLGITYKLNCLTELSHS